ncbi:hypothetical protein [Paenibacillus sp. UNC451MF]|uniref:hypothetical protein n=1 Tax=Paenibacillus sp. UNC451MF TaxID=1449063 RepID=UPI00048AB8CB|nr:hypothetical protein [Paenibacillus sp. UNC451MF]
MQMQLLITVIVGIFIMYRIFMRIRRNLSWQQLNPGRMQVVTVIFTLIGLIFLLEGTFQISSVISDIIGILAGIILAYFGALLTQLEKRNGHWFYRPNLWIGGLVTVIFIGRLIYRIVGIFSTDPLGTATPGNHLASSMLSTGSGWTSGLMLIMFAYYVTYNLILLRKQKFVRSQNVIRTGSSRIKIYRDENTLKNDGGCL